jgi:dihydroorotate dehydrogenase electron transfer subunit
VLWNRSITPEVFSIGLSCQTGYFRTIAGQFVMVRPVDQISPLLGRPFSIYSLVKSDGVVNGIELLVKVVGEGTRQLSTLKAGAPVSLLGPLGNGFDILSNSNPKKEARHFLVAGGIGIAPLVFLAKTMIANGILPRQCELFVGGRSSADLLGIEQCEKLEMRVHPVTEDGSIGAKGRVTERVEAVIERRRPDRIYACGPWAMLAALDKVVAVHRISCQVSVETMMGCGMGVCLSCVVRSRDSAIPYRHACTEGPVMDTRSIKF